MSASVPSSQASVEATPENSMLLQPHDGSSSTIEMSPTSGTDVSGVGHSWASEFQRREEEEPSLMGSAIPGTETDDAVSRPW